MHLYLIESSARGYDTFDAAVVAAESPEEAIKWHPDGEYEPWADPEWCDIDSGSWDYKTARVTQCLGDTSLPAGVILASFNAG